MPGDIRPLLALAKQIGDTGEAEGFDVELKIRAQGSDADRITYRTGAFAAAQDPQDNEGDDDDN